MGGWSLFVNVFFGCVCLWVCFFWLCVFVGVFLWGGCES